MADEQAGTVSVKAMPDTKGFRRALKAALEKIERSLEVAVELLVEIDKASLAKAKAQLNELGENVKATVEVDIDGGSLRQAQAQIRGLGESTRATVNVEAGGISETRAQIDRLTREVSDLIAEMRVSADTAAAREAADQVARQIAAQRPQMTVEMETAAAAAQVAALTRERMMRIDADVSQALRAVEAMVNEVESQGIGLDVAASTAEARAALDAFRTEVEANAIDLDTDVHTLLAAAELEALTRDRIVNIYPQIASSALARATGQLAALSGARVMGDFGRSVRETVLDLDRAIPKLSLMSTLLGSLVNVAGAAGGALLVVSSSVLQMGKGIAMMPALLMATGVAGGVLVAALKDAGDVLGDLGPQFSALQDSISASFWAQAAPGIRGMVSALMPLLKNVLPWIAEDLGIIALRMSNAIQYAHKMGTFTELFHNMLLSGEDMAVAFGSLTGAFLNFVQAGAKYLPQMASWFADISMQFARFAERVTSDGTFDRWVESAWANMKAFGSVLASTVGILAAVQQAAENAGSIGLVGLADGLNRVEDALKSEVWQTTMTTLFSGWNAGLAAMGPGLSTLADGLHSIAPTLATISVLAGEAASAIFDGLGRIAQEPAFQKGLVDLFTGIRDGLRAVADVAPEIGQKLGKLMTLAGEMAAVFGDVLATAVEELGPALNDVLDAAVVLVPILGGYLMDAIELLAPIIRDVVEAISEWVQDNPELASGLIVAASAVGALGFVVSKLVGFIMPVVKVVKTLIDIFKKIKLPGGAGGFGGIGKALSGIGRAASRLLGPIGLVIGLFAAMWTNSEDLRASVSDLWTSFTDFATALWDKVSPAIQDVADKFSDLGPAIEGVLAWFGEAAGVLGDFLGVFIELIADSFKVITEWLEGDKAGMEEAGRQLVDDFFSGLGEAARRGMELIWEIVKSQLDQFLLNWGLSWDGLVAIAKLAWENLTTWVTEAWAALQAAWDLGIEDLKTSWNEFWLFIQNAPMIAWTLLTTWLTEAWNQVKALFALAIEEVKTAWQEFWDGLLLSASMKWIELMEWAKEALANLRTTFDVLQGITTLWDELWSGFKLIAMMKWAELIAWFTEAWVGLQTSFQTGIALVRSLWTIFWDWVRMKVSEIWEGVKTDVALGIVGILTSITTGLSNIRAAWSLGWENIRLIASTIWDGIKTAIAQKLIGIGADLAAKLMGYASTVQNGWSTVKSNTISAWAGIVADVTSALSRVGSAIQSGISLAKSILVSAWAGIVADAAAGWNRMITTVQTAFSGIVMAITNGGASSIAEVRTMVAGMLAELVSTVSGWVEAGANLVQGLISGIKSKAASAASEAATTAKNALSAAKSVLGINSPSKEFIKVGKWSSEGFAIGIKSAARLAVEAAKKMASDTVKAAAGTKGSMTAAAKSVSGIWAEFVNSPSTTKAAAQRDWAKKVMPKMAAAMKGQWGRIGTTAGSELAKGLQGSVGQVAKTAKDMQAAITKQLDMNARGSKVPGHYERSKANGYDYYGIHYKKMVDSAASALKRLAATEAQLKTKLAGLGGNAAQGMAAGIRDQIKSVQDQAKRLAATLVATVRTQLDINSPSRVMAQLGAYAGRGFTVGLDHEAAAAQSAMAALVAAPRPVTPQAPATGPADGDSTTGTGISREELLAALAGLRVLLDEREITTGIREGKRRRRDTAPL